MWKMHKENSRNRFGRNWKDKPAYRAILGTFTDDEAEASLHEQSEAIQRAELLIESLVSVLGEIYDYRAQVIARHKARELDSSPSL